MALNWGPNLYSFTARITENRLVKFECGFNYDENYSDSVTFVLSFFPLIKNGTSFKFTMDNMDISQSILLLQNLLNGNIKEGILINRPNRKVYIKKESDHLYKLYFLVPDNNTFIDMTTKEVYNLLSLFEMLKSSYFNIACLVYAGGVKYINANKKNNYMQNKQFEQKADENKEILESIPVTSVINNTKIESVITMEQSTLSQAIKDVTNNSNHVKEVQSDVEDINGIVDDVFSHDNVVENDNKPFTEHVGSNKTVDDLAKAIFG